MSQTWKRTSTFPREPPPNSKPLSGSHGLSPHYYKPSTAKSCDQGLPQTESNIRENAQSHKCTEHCYIKPRLNPRGHSHQYHSLDSLPWTKAPTVSGPQQPLFRQTISGACAIVNEQSLMLLANTEGIPIQLNMKNSQTLNCSLAFIQPFAEATELGLVPQSDR